MEEKTIKRCAIYARKSTDEGLDQQFNSLDAQRESCEAYITSQKMNGWVALPERYEDGGFSGGNTNRPALKRLLADCEAGKVDIIICYKVDRLSRSLCDFTDLSKMFSKWGVAFVSVTQQIDTSTSSGKMMMNLLMTFAEYEREIISERIRDKMAATRRKGLWAGGCVAIGYTLKDSHLYPNPDEAPVVQRIFRRYIETQSCQTIAAELNADGVRTRKGTIWNKQQIYRILNNYAYVGLINYKGEIIQASHEPIIQQDTWDKAHEFLAANDNHKASTGKPRADKVVHENYQPLKGLLTCGHCGGPLYPYSRKKNGRIYSYYRCLRDSKRAVSTCPIRQVSGKTVETLVGERLTAVFRTPEVVRQIASAAGKDCRSIMEMFDKEFWSEATSGERYRLFHLLLARATLYTDRLDIEIKTDGINSIMEELENECNQD